MASQSVSQTNDLFKAGQTVQYSGEYNVCDAQGQPQGQDQITLDEGDVFSDVKGIDACYQLNPTCLEEQCEVMGVPTPDIE